jgi:ABC-type antimicrobial peptide transport system permease subunit
MRALVYFTLRDLVFDWGRSLLTILSLAVVVVSYLLLSALSQAFILFGRQPQLSSNLVIVSADVLDPMDSSLPEDILQTARQVAPQQIQAAFPTIFRHMSIQDHIMQVRAVPLEAMQNALALTLLQGKWPEGPRQVVISEGALQITSWKIGDSITIYGRDFQVVGLVRAGGNKFASVWMTYPEGQSLFGTRRGFQIGTLQLVPAADPERVRASLQADSRFSGGYSVYLENTLNDRYNQVNHDLLTLSGIQALISLLAITFGTYNAVNLTLTERSHEILLLRVVGFSQARLRGFLLAHTLVLSSFAFFLGWVVAFIFTCYQQTHAPISIQAAPLVLHLSVPASLLGFLLTVAFSFLGVSLSAGRLSTLSLSARGE